VNTATTSPRRRRPWWLRWAIRLGAVLLVGLAAYGYLWYRADAALRAELARLDRDDPGWRLDDLEAARATVPEEENSARVVVATAGMLPEGWHADEYNDFVKPLSPPVRLTRPDSEVLWDFAEDRARPLAEARKLTDRPRGRYRISYAKPHAFLTSLRDQEKARVVACLLGYDVLCRVEQGDSAGALADCRAIVNAGRSIGDEPTAISQLLRNACVGIGCDAGERVLARGEPPARDLAVLQRLLEEEDAYPGLRVALRGERAAWHISYIAFESDDTSAGPGIAPDDFTWRLLAPYRRSALRADHPRVLSILSRYVEATRLPPGEEVAAVTAIEADPGNRKRTDATDDRPLHSCDMLVSSFRYKHARLRSLIVCLAVEHYRLAQGRWPAALDDLVPAQLARVPLDPFDARPLRYRRLPDGVVVYAVGRDGVDDGGTFDAKEPARTGSDVGYRLWDPDQRGRAPAEKEGAAP
jgi:hypothetical protein